MASSVSDSQQTCSFGRALKTLTSGSRNPRDSLTAVDYVVLSGEMPGIRNIWHPRTVEYVDLLAVDMSQSSNEMLRQPRSNVVAVKSPLFPVPVVAKFAVWPETIKDIDKESKGYLLVNSHNIGPKVLGHITEEGRVIGLVLERLDGHPATLEHLAACKEALGKLHDLGLQHGNLWCKSFVVKDGKATIVDFEEVRPLWDECRLALEMQDLEWALEAGDDLDDDDY